MPKDRCIQILKHLHFDDKTDRLSRRSDNFRMIREVWDRFISNSQSCYVPEAFVTIDEQLLPSKSRCAFLQFMPNKPDKYGIKFWLLVCLKTKFVCNGFPYLGKHEERAKDVGLGEFVVKKLIEPYSDKGYNITADYFFTSLKIFKNEK